MSRRVRYTEAEARDAIAASRSFSEALRRLGMRPAGGNHRTLRKYAEQVWRIPTDHFDPYASQRAERVKRDAPPLSRYLTENSDYSRASLKRRLFQEGLKARRCERCGQGEEWHGRRMTLILDHINGVANDNRLENLQIVCPNCAATLDTHCGRNLPRRLAECPTCRMPFHPKRAAHRYCSPACWNASDAARAIRSRARRRKVTRPSYAQLTTELRELGWVAVGAKYGVTDSAVRKWMRRYEAERAASGSGQFDDRARPSGYPEDGA